MNVATMRCTRVSGSLAMLLIAVASSSSQRAAAADDAELIGELDALVRRADFDAAEARADNLLRSGSLTRPQAARVYLALGVVASARRDAGNAELAFRRALMLNAELALPSGLGPHVAASFERARAALASSPTPASPLVMLTAVPGTARFRVETGGPSGDGLARRFVVRVAGLREDHVLGNDPSELVVSLPASVVGCATASVGLLDEHGNELWPAVASAEVCRPAPMEPTAVVAGPSGVSRSVAPPDRKPGLSRAVWVTGAMTGALVAATGVLGWVAVESRDDYHASLDTPTSYGERQRLMEDASTAQTRATIGAVATGVMAATTLIFYLVGRH